MAVAKPETLMSWHVDKIETQFKVYTHDFFETLLGSGTNTIQCKLK